MISYHICIISFHIPKSQTYRYGMPLTKTMIVKYFQRNLRKKWTTVICLAKLRFGTVILKISNILYILIQNDGKTSHLDIVSHVVMYIMTRCAHTHINTHPPKLHRAMFILIICEALYFLFFFDFSKCWPGPTKLRFICLYTSSQASAMFRCHFLGKELCLQKFSIKNSVISCE